MRILIYRYRPLLFLVGYSILIAVLTLLFLVGLGIGRAEAQPLNYPVVYVSSPRPNATSLMMLPDVHHPIHAEPSTSLMLLMPGGAPEVLVGGGATGAAIDPAISFDAQWVYYAYNPDVSPAGRNAAAKNLPRANFDLYKIHVTTRQVIRLTHSEWEPLATGAISPQALGHGVFNTGPAPLPGNKLAFTSTRNNLHPNKDFTDVNLQLFVLDETTGITEQIGYLNLGSALHPVTMTDGRLLFSSYEGQGIRDRRLWGLWLIKPDGTDWEPAWSAYESPLAAHWHGQKSDGKIVSTLYYFTKQSGFGGIVQFPYFSMGNLLAFMRFGSANPANSPLIPLGARLQWRWPFQPGGMTALVPFAEPADFPSAIVNGTHVGKVSHPSGAPGNSVLLTWSGASPTQWVGTPAIDAGIYLLPAGVVPTHPSQLVKVIDQPDRNETQARALVPYRDIYGIDAPSVLPWLPQGQHITLPPGTPYALIGTSSLYKRDSAPGQGTDFFNRVSNPTNPNWVSQGADAGKYTNDDIHALRIVVLEPTAHKLGYQMGHFSHTNERARILGYDIPVRKPGAPPDPDGNPDTSFLARIPADVAFTFQLMDAKGMVLTNSQTWHQARPGSVYHACGGCHAHSQQGTDFARTVAGQPGYVPTDLTQEPLRSIEYVGDIRPLWQPCVGCHSTGQHHGGLVLDNIALDTNGLSRDYNTLANDNAAQYGRKPATGAWRFPNASAYVRMLQSRRSLLMWKLYNARLDGYKAGDRADDIDFVSAGCTAHTVLSDEDKRTVSAWIDLGAGHGVAWDIDSHKPTVALVDTPAGPVLGLHDSGSGLDNTTLAVTLDGAVQTPTALGDGRWQLPRGAGRWKASIKDKAGNIQVREMVSQAPPLSAGHILYQECKPQSEWDALTPTQQANWERCAQP